MSWRGKVTGVLATCDPGLGLVVLLSMFALYPLLHPGLPFTADGLVHLYRAVELNEAWKDGVYFPRWAEHLGLGYGIPLFNFAPPLPYYIIVAFHRLGLSFEGALKALTVGGFLAYGLGMYLLVRDSWGRKAGLLAAAAHIYVPYRLREGFIQGNYAQFLSLVFLPFALWAFRRVIAHGRRGYVVVGALALAGAILSHNVTALLFAPVLLAYIGLLLCLYPRKERIAMAAVGIGLGLGFSASFWVPALLEKNWIQTSRIVTSDYHARFVPWRELFSLPVLMDAACENSYFPFSLGTALLVLSIIALAGLLVKGRGRRKETIEALFFLLVAGFFSFMATAGSTRLWEHLPFLALLEWPWRMHGLALVGLGHLAGMGYGIWWGERGGWPPWVALMGALLGVLILSFLYLYPRYESPLGPEQGPEEVIGFEVRTGLVGTTSLREFHPIWVEEFPSQTAMTPVHCADGSRVKLDSSVLPPGAQATCLEQRAQLQRYHFSTPRALRIRFNTFYFPGWRAYLDDQPTPIHIAKPRGTIEIEVPAGEHWVELIFEDTRLRWVAEATSAASLGISLLWLGLAFARPRLKSPAKAGKDEGFTGKEALGLAMGLLLIFILKATVIDSHTSWFLRHSPPDTVPNVQHPMRADFGDKVRFLGYDMDRDTVSQGGQVKLVLYWRALEDLDRNYVPTLQLQAPPYYDEVYAQTGDWHPDDIPTARWSPERYVRDPERLTIPLDIPPILYPLHLGMYDVRTGERLILEGGGNALVLAALRVTRARPLTEADIPQEARARLDNGVELVGYGLQLAEDKPAKEVTVTLYWRARREIYADYTVFIHLLDSEGQIVAQHDSMPVEGKYPTSFWQAEEIVEDSHQMGFVGGLPGGSYRLAVGMYVLETMTRAEVQELGKGVSLNEGRIVLGQPIDLGS